MLSLVKMLLKGEVGDCALNSHGNYIVDHGKSWEIYGIVFLNFCENPGILFKYKYIMIQTIYIHKTLHLKGIQK